MQLIKAIANLVVTDFFSFKIPRQQAIRHCVWKVIQSVSLPNQNFIMLG